MLWNCPHCNQHITPKTLKSVPNPSGEKGRTLRCPHCNGEVEMNVHTAEYRQIAIPCLGLGVLWWAGKTGTTFAMVIAAIAVAGGLASTMYINKRVLKNWQRFRAATGKSV